MKPELKYDQIAEVYSSARQKNYATRRFQDFWFDKILTTVPVNKNAIVLDCMCGSCEFARSARPRVAQLHATDVSLGILSHAEQTGLPNSRTCADARCLPYADNSFDLVFVIGGLHHVHSDFKTILGELHRVLKPGGWLACTEPADDNPVIYALRELMHRVSELYEEGERGFSARELSAVFDETGFVEVGVRRSGYLAYTLIGNTDVLPVFATLKNRVVIDTLIAVDRISPHIPLWKYIALALTVFGRAQK